MLKGTQAVRASRSVDISLRNICWRNIFRVNFPWKHRVNTRRPPAEPAAEAGEDAQQWSFTNMHREKKMLCGIIKVAVVLFMCKVTVMSRSASDMSSRAFAAQENIQENSQHGDCRTSNEKNKWKTRASSLRLCWRASLTVGEWCPLCVYVCVCMQTLFFHLICVFSCVSLLCGRDELLRFSLSSTVQRSVTVVLPPQVAEGHGVPLGPDALRAH